MRPESREIEERANIRLVLMRWGQSRLMNDAYEIDYPHQSPYCEDMRQSGGWAIGTGSLKDENHALVDRHVSELKRRCDENPGDRRYRAICLSYIRGFRDSQAAKRLKCSTSSAREARIAGENWLDGRIDINLLAM